jgi:hypothetical protein
VGSADDALQSAQRDNEAPGQHRKRAKKEFRKVDRDSKNGIEFKALLTTNRKVQAAEKQS